MVLAKGPGDQEDRTAQVVLEDPDTGEVPTAPARGAPQTGDHTATGPRVQIGATALGRHGGEAAHAPHQTGPVGQLDPGVVLRHGRAGADVQLQRRQRVLLPQRLMEQRLPRLRTDCKLLLRVRVPLAMRVQELVKRLR